MLEHTFLHIPGIGRATEQRIWESGVRTWADADALDGGATTIRPRVLAQLQSWLPASRRALQQKDAGFFGRLCSLGEAWRVFSRFAQDCVYLDIETTGLSAGADDITLVGVYDGETYKAFIAGRDLTALPEHLRRFRLISTFNGAGFDLRFLRVAFPQLAFPPIHIDLRPTTRKLGLTGGLKAIEAALGLQRDPSVRDLSGFDAVLLWRRHLRGDRQALDLLVEYNRADVVNLKTILDLCYDRLATEASMRFGAPPPIATVPAPDSEALTPPTPNSRGPAAR
ncbi:MAG TPA: ribonuclease H-like domain-containing protein [Candidatus Acidoferrum sp.]|nr:ribonuclease H-like domain-containing protein [Candidatus Acidoferrum sp.]